MRLSVDFKNTIPNCATSEQFILWKEAARMHRPNPRVGFCEDCTKGYQEIMMSESRCENPHVWFCKDEDGFEHGTLKIKEEESVNE
jgi:hypothetical protein